MANENTVARIVKGVIEEAIAYHGSNNIFDTFDIMYCGRNIEPQFGFGIYLTTSKDVARSYMNEMEESFIYHVSIPDDDSENYITFDRPITDNQYRVLTSSLSDEEMLWAKRLGLLKNCSGITAYNVISKLCNCSDKDASEYFFYSGIIGMKFQDQDDEGVINFVMFDDSVVEIVGKER